MGVWIETNVPLAELRHTLVTPCVGVWIETVLAELEAAEVIVTPCVGVWIETVVYRFENHHIKEGHTLRGCVD